MTDLNSLTLADIEALAERLGAAARTIREAQAMLGGPVPIAPQISHESEARFEKAMVAQRERGAPNPLLTASENAERQRLIKMNTMSPDDIEAMERK